MLRRHFIHRLPIYKDRPGGWLFEPRDNAKQCRFAASRWADNGNDFAIANFHGYIIDCGDVAETTADVLKLNCSHNASRANHDAFTEITSLITETRTPGNYRGDLHCSSHLWRQRFPGGTPEQITFGPLEELGIAVAPDGRSLVTSVGTRRSAIWIHDKAGERAISSEGHALAPRLSRDGTRVFFLLVRDWWLSARGWVAASAELRSIDLASGKSDRLLTGVSATGYDISPDEKEVVFTTTDSNGGSQILLASLDRRAPPRQIVQSGDQVSFGADGDIVFRSREEKTNVLARIKKDGSGRERITAAPILNKYGVSPDGKWVVVQSPESDKTGSSTLAVPISGGAPQKICIAFSGAFWSYDGRFFYYQPSPGKTLAIPVPAGKSLPDLPCSGISAAAAGVVPRATVLEHTLVSPGPDPSTYVFTRTDNQRNLFRIPLH